MLFANRRRTSIKILQWDGSGFWILMKKLDGNSFHWPDTPDDYLLTYILVSFLVFLPFLIPFSM
ncbi:MAG: IS66 family insertion sequence element accessory protein TnpB [Anaerobutyricum hallii]|uniref:IS66 family insertion sequence element accessory protein TnpB n=1 Tax=Anaerobutyricum hallii TaxID=39488 RepID=UPI00399343F7